MTGPAFVAGVDGCRGGWAVVLAAVDGAVPPRLLRAGAFAEVLALAEAPAVVAVDMPIGLPERIEGPGRAAEQAVRPLLGPRQSSVFSIASRRAVEGCGADFRLACALARETSTPPKAASIQSFGLYPKIREIDRLLLADPALAARVFEVHPEVGFWRLNGARPMALPKKVRGQPNPAGLDERIALLARHGVPPALFEAPRPPGVGRDDAVDAAVSAVIARRILAGAARPFPDPPPRDAHGLAMAIWA